MVDLVASALRKTNHTTISPIVPLVWSLNNAGIWFTQFAIVGGAVRDTYHNRPFKDVDIAVIGAAASIDVILDTLLTLKAECLTVTEGAYEERPVEWVIKGMYQDTAFDLVKYHVNHTVEAVVERFDLNLNTWWMDQAGRIHSLPGTCRMEGDPVYLHNPHQGMNQKMKDRIVKFNQKYPQYNWEADNRIIEVLNTRRVVRGQQRDW